MYTRLLNKEHSHVCVFVHEECVCLYMQCVCVFVHAVCVCVQMVYPSIVVLTPHSTVAYNSTKILPATLDRRASFGPPHEHELP